ncbi:hypothetical protein EVAR_81861_1 [Eumeta japonica]|uniref:Uncharacterized protein n=1 Tax=Eumeta variegata TaxID=151549 RepID=A0A4C2A0J8_EUMVA|nr:hypothetical protein EVAR_81861_1 [Eumeta japonica]
MAIVCCKRANIIKTKWSESSTSLRSRHIVDLALNESDRTPRSSASANPFASDSRSSPHPSPLSFKLSLQFKLPKTVKYPQNWRPVAYSLRLCIDVLRSWHPKYRCQPTRRKRMCQTSTAGNQAQADSEWRVSTDVVECALGTEKLLMELEIN